jgi:hypothetical protein
VFGVEPFPEPWELISLFESEPTLLDPEVPWVYNSVTFMRERAGERIECTIHQADHEFAFSWTVDSRTVIRLDLNTVVGIEVRQTKASAGLAITTSDAHLGPLQIQISPHVSVIWNASSDLD